MSKNDMIDYILSQAKKLIIGVNRVDLNNMSYKQVKSFYDNIGGYYE